MRWIITLTLLASITQAGRADLSEYRRRAARVNPQSARDHFVLALWCEKKGMPTEAWKHHAVVLELQPKHRASLRAAARLKPDVMRLAREALTASTKRRRIDAARALKRIPRPSRWILPTLRSRSETMRMRAIRTLGMLGDEGAVKPLVRHLSVAGGNTTGAYMAVGGQTSHVRDFDVEIA